MTAQTATTYQNPAWLTNTGITHPNLLCTDVQFIFTFVQTTKHRIASREALAEIARGQGGYFTLKQAQSCGFDRQHMLYHGQVGNVERAGRGLYRLSVLPGHEQDDLIRAVLWSRDRSDVPQAIVSHATALALHGLSDWLPGRIELTVPLDFRRRTRPAYTLFRRTLGVADIEQREGYAVTKPLRTLHDCVRDQTVPPHELVKAVRQAIDRGLVRERQLASEARTDAALRELLDKANRR